MNRITRKYYNLPIQAKASLWLVIANVINKGISFLTMPIFTRLLPESEYGELSVFLSSTEILLILTGWDISYGAYQKGLYKYDDVDSFTKVTQLFTTVTTCVFVILMLVAYPYIGSWIAIPIELFPFLLLYLLGQPAYRNWMVKKQKIYDYKKVTAVTLIYALLTTLISIMAVLLLSKTAKMKYTAQILSSAFIFIFFYFPNVRINRISQDKRLSFEQIRFIILFQFPCVIHSLSLVLLSQADRIMIRNFIGSSEAALYSVAYTFAFLLSVVQTALDQAMIPWRYELLKKNDYKMLDKMSNTCIFIIGGLVTAFILVAPELMKLFFPVGYSEAVDCIPPIAMSVYFIFLYSVFASIEAYFEYTNIIMGVSLFCCIANIIMNIVGMKLWGYKACAFTTLISYILFCVGHFYGMRWICKKRIGQKLFAGKTILGFTGVLLIVNIVIYIFYNNLIIRLICFMFLLIITYKYKDKIIKTLKKNKE